MIRSLVVLISACATVPANADIVYSVFDDPSNSPDAVASTGGTLDLWSVSGTSNTSNGTSTLFGETFWTLGAHSGGSIHADSAVFSSLIGRSLSATNDSMSLIWRSGSLGNVAGSSGSGVNLSFTFFDSSMTEVSRFTWAGNTASSQYTITDGTGTSSLFGFTTTPFSVGLTLENQAGDYSLHVAGVNFGIRQLAAGATNVDRVRVRLFSNIDPAQGSEIAFRGLSLSPTAVPEPSAFFLVGLTLVVAGCWRTNR